MAKNTEPKKSIHPSIKQALGYEPQQSDREVFDDWKQRKSRVCKPCWELKYCPYGPLVEQSPCLPVLRDGMEEQIEYFEKCLSTNLVGSVEALTPELKSQYEEWLADEQVLLSQAAYQLGQEEALAEASKHPTDAEKINAWMGELPPIHIYRTKYEEPERDIREEDFEPERWNKIVALAQKLEEKYQTALKVGSIDHRHPLEPARAAWFNAPIAYGATGNFRTSPV